MMTPLLWLVYVVVGSTAYVYVAFLGLCTAKRIQAAGIEMPWDMRLVAQVLLVLGVPADILYNWTRGAWMFRDGWRLEWRGYTFSSHIQQRVDAGLWDPLTANWARLLNAGDALHIRRTPTE